MSVPVEPLTCMATSPVVDPVLTSVVDVAPVDPHSPTTGPNRYTITVPSESTRLSLGQKLPLQTDMGITGYSDNHVHFEVKTHDQTVVSLGGPATTAVTLDSPAPLRTHGYAMVTKGNAWHDAMGQHYLLSQKEDISLSTRTGERAVVQSDHGMVDLNGGKQVSLSGGGIAIGAGELEVEDRRYEQPWEGKRPHSKLAGGGKIALAVAGACAALHDLIVNKVRSKFEPGKFEPAPAEWGDKNKRKINSALFGLSLVGLTAAVIAKNVPPKGVKFDADESVGFMAGGTLGFFGLMTASIGAAAYATVSAGVSAAVSALGFAGVGGSLVAIKGFRKVEFGSDWGKAFIGAEEEIKFHAEKNFIASAKTTAHLASEVQTLLGSTAKTFIGTSSGAGWGLSMAPTGFKFGKTATSNDMAARNVAEFPSIVINKEEIFLQVDGDSKVKLGKSNCTITVKELTFTAASGDLNVKGPVMVQIN